MNSETRKVMSTLASKGVVTVRLSFSGGNDDGGVDHVEYLDSNGNLMDLNVGDANYAHRTERYEGGRWVYGDWEVSRFDRDEGRWITRPATPEEIEVAQINQVLEAPIYDHYGSFAGEFSVQGAVTWNVASGTYKMHGDESTEVWNSFSYEG